MATRTWDNGGGDGLASTATNWSDNTAPVDGDTVVFSNTSTADCDWDVTTNLGALTVNSTYTGVITQSAALTVSDNSLGGTRIFTFNGGTWNSNGQDVAARFFDASGSATKTLTMGASTWSIQEQFDVSGTSLTLNANTSEVIIRNTCNLKMASGLAIKDLTFNDTGGAGGAFTATLQSNFAASGTVDLNAGTATITISGAFTLYAGGLARSSGFASGGTTAIELNGTGTWSDSASNFNNHPVTINTAGTITLSGTITQRASVVYTAGTVDPSTSTMVMDDTLNLNMGTAHLNNLTVQQNTTTLTGDLILDGDILITGTGTLNASSRTITIAGNFTRAAGTFTRGTSTVIFNG